MIKLHDGTKVRVEGVIMSRPYGGMMEGVPTKEMSCRIIAGAKESFKKQWGARKVHVVEPARTPPRIMGYDSPADWPERVRQLYEDPERLPDNLFQVWLTSFTSYDPDDDGTAVVLVFFTDKESAVNKSLNDLVVDASKTFEWKEVAQGFGY